MIEKPTKVIDLVGAGNLAHHLARRCTQKGWRVRTLFVRSINSVGSELRSLCQRVVALDDSSAPSDSVPVILAVSDDAVAMVSKHVHHQTQIHTSGSVPLSALASGQKAVLYPLQTFSHGVSPDWNQIPVCIEASDAATLEWVRTMATDLSPTVTHLDSEQRKHVHLAAVVVNNLVNHLYWLADQHLHHEGVKFELLLPLITETTRKLEQMSPDQAQTGPARRNDQSTLRLHKELLADDPKLQAVYHLITEQIITRYHG
jgi:predicted short-subunit dehydrogenase-like oxidoreductase (DUF2520 family)